ncbi:transposase [Dysgonomonas sp. 521]|nr:transposase [Dysgonomonas sp. 521]
MCGGNHVVKNGFQKGKQRYKCKDCNCVFQWRNKSVSQSNRFIWFRQWIVGKQTLSELEQSSGYSKSSLKRYFHTYLSDCPTWKIRPSEKVNLLIDGTYFNNKVCLVLYRDNNIKATQLYRLTDREWFDEICEDLENLLSLGIKIESVTCDGLSNIIKAVRKICPEAIIQRCVVHIQRECLIWLSRNPQSQAGKDLRYLVGQIHLIRNRTVWGYWVVDLIHWYEKYQNFINQKSYYEPTGRYWYTHKMLRRAFIHIKRALPDMFHYLDNPDIPKSTNGLESFFGHLKQNIAIHRGLSKEHYKNYIKWYLFFKSNE